MVSQTDKCIDIVIDTLASIETHHEQIAAHNEAIKRLKQEVADALRESAIGLTRDELMRVGWELYWYTPIGADALAAMLGVKAGIALNKILGAFPSGDFCKWCGEELMFLSRTERAQILKDGRSWMKELCPNCERHRQELTTQQYRRERDHKEAQLIALKAMPYRDYLATEHWQKVRESALKRGRYRCQLCNGTGVLDVHHRTYERRGEEHASDVIVLCRDCHGKFHDKL